MDATVEWVSRESIPEQATWNLSGLFASDQDWEELFKTVESGIPGYEEFRGTLSQSARHIKHCLDFDMDCARKLERIFNYAHLRNDEDKTHSGNQQKYEKSMRIRTQWMQARSFIDSELVAIPTETMETFLADDDLADYKYHIQKILRFQDHILSEKEEALLASCAELSRASYDAFGMLDNADLQFGTVKDSEGKETRITHGNFGSLLQSYDRPFRKNVFETFYKAYENHRYTFSSLLASNLKKDLFYSRTRSHASTREKALFDENIPVQVYDNLITTVHENLEPLYKYFALRKKILGLEELHIYDCAVPLVKDFKWSMTYEEAVDKTLEAVKPLGEEYGSILKRGLLEDRWVDRFENKGKRSGAYSSGCYDSNPFILLNYKEDHINSLYTLAHEAGHSMHSYFSRSHQSYVYADYTIFVAEVASTFNEAMLTRYFMDQNPDREMKIYLLCREIDNFRGTLYRQTMFAEFEHLIHKAVQENQPMTVEAFQETYKKLLELYFGEGVVLDDCLNLECFRIPHFYFGFYVYKYATGISAAYALVDRVLNGGEQELQDYLNFLKSGGSEYPIDLLKGAGIDMTHPAPIQTALSTFSRLVDELESLCA